jgi:hypothetical protein
MNVWMALALAFAIAVSAVFVSLRMYEPYNPPANNKPVVKPLGGLSAKSVEQYGSKGSASASGSQLSYSATYNTGDGNKGKNPKAVRVEDSWKGVLQNASKVEFQLRNTNKTGGDHILNNVQIKTNPKDPNPAVAIGQKGGYWVSKTKGNDSVQIMDSGGKPIPATQQINARIEMNGDTAKVMVNNQQVAANIPVRGQTILKTGVYTSDKYNTMEPGDKVGVQFNNVKVVS